jgi:hypothetical protein
MTINFVLLADLIGLLLQPDLIIEPCAAFSSEKPRSGPRDIVQSHRRGPLIKNSRTQCV